MEGGQEVTYAYTSDNNTVTVIGDPSVSGHEIQLDPNSSSQAQQIFQVSNSNSGSTDRSQKSSTPFAPVKNQHLSIIRLVGSLLLPIILHKCNTNISF